MLAWLDMLDVMCRRQLLHCMMWRPVAFARVGTSVFEVWISHLKTCRLLIQQWRAQRTLRKCAFSCLPLDQFVNVCANVWLSWTVSHHIMHSFFRRHLQIQGQLILPRTAVVFLSLLLHSIKSNHTFNFQETPANEAKAEPFQDYVFVFFVFQDVWDELFHITPCIHSSGETCRSRAKWYCQGLLWCSCPCCCTTSNQTIHLIFRRPRRMKPRLNHFRTMCLFLCFSRCLRWIVSHHTNAFNLQERPADPGPSDTAKDCCGVLVLVVAQHQITPCISFTGDPGEWSQGWTISGLCVCFFVFQDVWDELFHITPCIQSTGETCRSRAKWYCQGLLWCSCSLLLHSIKSHHAFHLQETHCEWSKGCTVSGLCVCLFSFVFQDVWTDWYSLLF